MELLLDHKSSKYWNIKFPYSMTLENKGDYLGKTIEVRILYLRKYGIIFIPDLILTIVFYIYSCTELPKRNRFISFFIKIFIAIAESPIPGAMISWMYMNSQAGFKCHLSWGILKWTISVKILHIFFFKRHL